MNVGGGQGVLLGQTAASEADLREAQRQRTLALMGQIPIENAATQALARYHNAQAAGLEQDNAEGALLAQIARGGAGGVVGLPQSSEPSDLGPMPQQAGGNNDDPLAPLRRVVTEGYQRGLLHAVAPYAKQLFDFDKDIATRRSEQAQEAVRQLQAREKHMELAYRLSRGVTDQATYDQMRMQLANQGEDVSDMPADYTQAQPMLRYLQNSGESLLAQTRRRIEEEQANSMKALRDARRRLVDTQVGLAAARTRVTQVNEERLRKALGSNAVKTTTDKLKQQKELNKLFDPMPQAESRAVPGRVYRNGKGALYFYSGKDWQPISVDDALTHMAAPDADEGDE